MYALLCLAAMITGEVATSATLLLISVAFLPLFGGIVLWGVVQGRSDRKMAFRLEVVRHFSNNWVGELVALPPKLAAVLGDVGRGNNRDLLALLKNQEYASEVFAGVHPTTKKLSPLPGACHT